MGATTSRTFYCPSCEKSLPTQQEAKRHLEQAHGIDLNQSATRRMVFHADGADRYMYRYEWDFGNGTKMEEEFQSMRTGLDRQIWEGME